MLTHEQLLELERQVREDDARWRRLQVRFESHSRLINAQMALAAELCAQTVAAAWYLALNPNLGRTHRAARELRSK